MSAGSGRALRVFAVTVLVLLVLLGVLDRVAVRVVAGQIASRMQSSENLAKRPDIEIGGFPFLTQVIAGRYRSVHLDARGYQQEDVHMSRVRAGLTGVRLPLSDALRKNVDQVPVDHVAAEVDLTFDDVNAYLARQNSQVRVSPAVHGIRVAGNVTVLGTTYPVSGTADIGVAADSVTFTPTALLGVKDPALASVLLAAARSLLTVQVPVTGLPPNLRLQSATVSSDHIAFAAAGENVLLTTNLTSQAVPPGIPAS